MSDFKQAITLYIHNNCSDFVGDDFYVTGNVFHWKVDGFYLGKIPKPGETLQIQLDVDIEIEDVELKINRGTWHTLTTDKNGFLLPPYHFKQDNGSSLLIQIEAWRDQFPKSTASQQVQLMSSAFYFPNLETHKRVWIYLPKDYKENKKHYPVLYMHDGQHLFDEATSTGRSGPVEWKVDKVIDQANDDAIVIAIEHAAAVEERKREYLLFNNEESLPADGKLYLADIIHTLKPFVDANYRTLAGREFTAMAGSSLAGLLSLQAGLLYPEVFSFLGVFSPSIWTAPEEVELLLETTVANKMVETDEQGYYYYAGGRERRRTEETAIPRMLSDMMKISALHQSKTRATIHIDVDDMGKHGALYWQKAFPRFYESWQNYMHLSSKDKGAHT